MNYDIIGDVHGHADKLEALLQKLGYQHRSGAWRKAGHTAVFVGDLIDGGPDQLRTLELVRAMVDQQCALVTMGNHEFNAIAYATRDPQRGAGYYLRPHTENHNRQHKAFLAEVGHRSARHTEWIDWFRTLPLWLELDDLRIVHACWHEPSIEAIRKRLDGSDRITEECLVNAHKLNGQPRCPAVHDAVETLLKGLESGFARWVWICPSAAHGHLRHHRAQCLARTKSKTSVQARPQPSSERRGAAQSLPNRPVFVLIPKQCLQVAVSQI
jgi:hypothetical protein